MYTELRNIYQHLGDDPSRSIFKHRLLYFLFQEKEEIDAMISECCPEYADMRSGKFCYYGAGEGGRTLLRKKPVPFLIDSYRKEPLMEKPILSLEEFLKLPDSREYLIVVSVGKERAKAEITEKLKQHGLRFTFGFFGTQYFDLPQLDLHDEYFVDAGALDGGTTRYFLDHFSNGHAYVFEPNPAQFVVTRECLKEFSQAEIFPYGLSDENAIVHFDPRPDDAGSAKIKLEGSAQIEARKLDDLLGDRKVTFIKMDIEGSELAALRGAERIIREQKPKLAICVYHKPEDIWEIPELILRYLPEYRLYLRHYSVTRCETVLYAVP